jgi:hypothetical protein
MRHLAVLICVLCAPFVQSFANADECSIAELKDNVVYSQDIRTNILYAREIRQDTQSNHQQDRGVNVVGYGNLTDKAQDSYISSFSDLTKLKIDSSDKRFLFVSSMGEGAVASYRQCLEHSTKNIYILPSPNSAASDTFSVEIRMRVYPTDNPIPVLASVRGGRFEDEPAVNWVLDPSKTKLSGKLREGGAIRVWINREMDKPFELSVAAGSENTQTEIASLPPVSPFYINEEIRYTNTFKTPCNGCEFPGIPDAAVLNLPADEVIIPGSESFEAIYSGSGGSWRNNGQFYSLKTEPEKAAYSAIYRPHNLNIDVGRGSVGAVGARWCGAGVISVKVLVPVPNGQLSSGRDSSHPKLSC